MEVTSMKIVIAPDSYKGSLSAEDVCTIIEKSIKSIDSSVEIIKMPISDGGEGLVNALLSRKEGKRVTCFVNDPLFRKIEADYGVLNDGTAIIEMAAVSGLPLLENQERNPLVTTTFGTGELIIDAIMNQNCKKIILGIGGSATNDGGMGLANALGVIFYDEKHNRLKPIGENLIRISEIDCSSIDPLVLKTSIDIACDVNNPLCGKNGSSYIYGPQKGGTKKMIKDLDQGLFHFGTLLENLSGKALINCSGMGAAGGIALPIMALLNGCLKSGLDIVLDTLGFDEIIKNADLVITGEGKTDQQTAMGKVISGVGKRSKKQGIPVVVISGALEEGYEVLFDHGITAAFSTYDNSKELKWHMDHAKESLEKTTKNIFNTLMILK